MKNNTHILKLATAGILISVGVLIPMISPIKILIEPASFTLASHVVIFLAMFISPLMAIAVACGTAAGFFLAGFPIIIVFRAITHIIFAGLGASYLLNTSHHLSPLRLRVFSLLVGLVHALCEVAVCSFFFFGPDGNTDMSAYMYFIVVLVGVGTLIHSMVDFELTLLIKAPLRRASALRELIH